MDRRDLYNKLRQEYPYFIYEDFSYAVVHNELQIIFDFDLAGKYKFRPSLLIPLPDHFNTDILTGSLFRNLIFNLGMVEMLSYWKAACSPNVIIKPIGMSERQLLWWKKLFIEGLGEFFYTNGIVPGNNTVNIKASQGERLRRESCKGNKGVLVPLGGGKDSVVSLELLSKAMECTPFIINPRPASLNTGIHSGYEEDGIIQVQRSIDPQLLVLNSKGFLNGHTPFSAMLAFTSVLTALIYGKAEVALSNESSANEPTIPGSNINHQYSKTLEFENDFRSYMDEYITRDINYYSFLRPINELQIAKLFSGFPEHYNTFRSCNVGSKTDSWCGQCPKCLFTFIILSPFIALNQLIRIFGRNLYEDETLIPILDQLTGRASEKPFECVGTINEVNAAINAFVRKHSQNRLPLLIEYYLMDDHGNIPAEKSFEQLLNDFGQHNLPSEAYVTLLKTELHG